MPLRINKSMNKYTSTTAGFVITFRSSKVTDDRIGPASDSTFRCPKCKCRAMWSGYFHKPVSLRKTDNFHLHAQKVGVREMPASFQ